MERDRNNPRIDFANLTVTWIANCKSKNSEPIKLMDSLTRIRDGASKKLISKIRLEQSEKSKTALKQKLPAICFSGVLEQRTKLKYCTGFACLDFDKVNDLSETLKILKSSVFIFACWLSPSGNGIKALVRIPVVNSKKTYKEYYKAIIQYFEHLNPDKSTSDINRLCFESYDPNLFMNLNASLFTEKIHIADKKYDQNRNWHQNLPEKVIIERLFKWWEKKYEFTPGNRNRSLFALACVLSKYGVNKTTTEDLFTPFEEVDFDWKEIQNLIDSAYKRTAFNSKNFSI
ncbi:primase C-terminal domain-containing protein [Gramella sp. GC03-9]|uniref:Primase C-terminal domain-containing protein n=1 Tax=Christiangramia oceanisediminis TaxID=2920386 RepID=A0A9X2I879_9FLAO|nr:BT4734/BF3469 family protein [Gramella oceanisediminis]MCP9199012.1 primase C-terminal domain-containing protein [Gramella oceanisediminis]